MGRYAYWITDLANIATVNDANERLGETGWELVIENREQTWAVCNQGRPQFWFDTREEAEATLPSDTKFHIEYFAAIWIVYAGDQYIFTTTDRSEADGFVFGMLAQSLLGSRQAHDPSTK